MKSSVGKAVAAAVLLGAGFYGQTVLADSHQVQAGESFFSIAQTYGISAYDLAANNGMSIYDTINPGDFLEVGDVYVEPTAAVTTASSTYTVQYGDSFSSIGAIYGLDAQTLASQNGLSIYTTIIPGQVLTVPVSTTIASVATATEPTTDTNDDYYIDGLTYEPGINYPVGQCTWAVQKLTGWAGDWWGNAADWAANAAREGYQTGTTPVVGAIAVWDDGAYGHVAYVSDVQSDTSIQVLEANYAGNQWIDNYRGWFNPQASTGTLTYIYPY